MSNTDDKVNFPTFDDIIKGRSSKANNHTVSGAQPRESGQKRALHADPRLNDQSEYSQVGGKRTNNQQYPSLGQQQNNNPNQGMQNPNGIDPQGGHPGMDSQNAYSQPYNQQNMGQYSQPDNMHPDPRFSAPTETYNQPDQNYDNSQYNTQVPQDGYGYSNPADQGYLNQGYGDAQSTNMDYTNYQTPGVDDPSRYSFPNDPNGLDQGQGYDNYSNTAYNQEGNDAYYDQSSQMNEDYYQGDEGYQDQVPQKKRGPVLAISLMTLLLAGGGLVYAYTNDMLPIGNVSTASTSSPLLISNDTKPFKVRPDDPGGKSFPNRNKLIYDRLSGKSRIGKDDTSRIVPRDEKVIDTASLNKKFDNSNNNAAGISVSNTSSLGGAKKTKSPSSIKTVKTIQVRPDGSFVGKSGGSSIPGISLGGQDTSSTSSQRSNDPGIAARTFSSGSSGNSIGQAFPPKRKVIQPEKKVFVPKPKPEPKRVAVAKQPERSIPSALSIQSSGSGQFAVQVAARRNETDALIAFADMQQKYPVILGSYQPLIQRADLTDKGKGVWYRLRVGPMTSRDQASTVCNKLKQQGIKGCFVKKL